MRSTILLFIMGMHLFPLCRCSPMRLLPDLTFVKLYIEYIGEIRRFRLCLGPSLPWTYGSWH